MGGAAGQQLPYQNITTTSDLPKWKKELYGFTKDAPEYSPFKALSRQAGTEAKMIEGMTTRPSWSSMYEAMGVPQGQDLTPYIQAMRTGTQAPQAPIPASPAAGTIPEFTAPSEEVPKKEAAQGGLMSLAKKRGFASGGLTADQANFLTNKLASGKKISPQWQKKLDAYNKEQTTKTDTPSTPAVPLSQAMNVVTPFYDQSRQYGQYGGVTNPIYQQALDQLRGASQTPSQFGQATGIMQSAADRLMAQAGYTPQQIQASQISRGNIRDVNAIQADVEKYRAANMEPPPELKAEAYQAAQMQGAQMQGPQSWTTPGTAEQYMDPYIKNVLETQQRIANQQFAQQQNQLRGQATGQKAFGGARAQLAQGQAQLNQNLANQNLVQQGLSGAYQSGLGQFNTAQAQGLQAGQANLQAALTTQQQNQAATNAQRQLYVQQALDAAKTSYGGALTAAQQNQIAQNAASQFNAQSQNQAYNNYVAQQLAAQQANQGIDYNTAMQNAQLQQQAAIQNQQAGLTAQGMNLQALNQAGQMGQGIGSLGSSMWGLQQNIPQLWGAAGQTVQGIAQQAATGAQQTAQNWWGGMNNAYAPVTNMLTGTPGTTGTQNTARLPGV